MNDDDCDEGDDFDPLYTKVKTECICTPILRGGVWHHEVNPNCPGTTEYIQEEPQE